MARTGCIWLALAYMPVALAQGNAIESIPTTTYSVTGLEQPAEILIDAWGVPHMYANDLYSAFFVQGFNAARDRLWQIDLWRRRGLGQLAEVFGSELVEQDRAARLFLYRGDMYTEWLAYGSDAKRIATEYANGINAFIKLTEENPDLLPWEFSTLGYEPAVWAPEDIVRIRSHGLVRNVGSEVNRAQFLRNLIPSIGQEAALEADQLRSPLSVPWDLTVPEGLDLSLIPDDVLNLYDLATSGVTFTPDMLNHTSGGPTRDPEQLTETLNREAALQAFLNQQSELAESDIGSNNWAVSPNLTESGRPILANDPHRGQSVPSLRYMAHIVAPGLDVIGAGEPALPGISIGHNERVAFGLTIFSIDQEDLYVYDINPNNPNQYRYQGRWVPMEVVNEKINVRGSDPVNVELKFTQHGPIVYESAGAEPQAVTGGGGQENPTSPVAFAVRAAWLEPGMAPYFGGIEYMRAQSATEFVEALNRWGSPAENQAFADVDGNFGWKPAGRAPIRPNWDGLLPVPGNGQYEWDGFYDMDQLPELINPERGWVSSNNEMRLFDEFEKGWEAYPYRDMKLGFEWSDPWRAIRTREVLANHAESGEITIQDMFRLQTDHFSIPAREIITQLGDVTATNSDVQAALDLLKNWDFVMDNDSAAAALFTSWTGYHSDHDNLLGSALLQRMVSPEVAEQIREPGDILIPEILQSPGEWFDSANPVVARNEAVLESLANAVASLKEELGPDMQTWRFGAINQQELTHALSPVVEGEMRDRIDLGPAERCAVSNTVGNLGASWRFIADVGNWDNTIAMSNPGQSGDPDSPYYDNLFPRWLNCGAFPLLYSRDLIEAAAEQRILLEPTNQ